MQALTTTTGSASTANPQPKLDLDKEDYRAIVNGGEGSPLPLQASTSPLRYSATQASTRSVSKSTNGNAQRRGLSGADELSERYAAMGWTSPTELDRGETLLGLKSPCGHSTELSRSDASHQYGQENRSQERTSWRCKCKDRRKTVSHLADQTIGTCRRRALDGLLSQSSRGPRHR